MNKIRQVLFLSAEKSADVFARMPMTEAERGMTFACGHEMPMDTPSHFVDESRLCPTCSNALYHQYRARERAALAEQVRVKRESVLALVRSGGTGRRHLIQWAKNQGHAQQALDLLGVLDPDDATLKAEILAADQFYRRVMP